MTPKWSKLGKLLPAISARWHHISGRHEKDKVQPGRLPRTPPPGVCGIPRGHRGTGQLNPAGAHEGLIHSATGNTRGCQGIAARKDGGLRQRALGPHFDPRAGFGRVTSIRFLWSNRTRPSESPSASLKQTGVSR